MIQKDLTLSVGNIIWIVGIIFTMGIAYSQIAQLDEDILVLEKRLEKKIKVINECEDRIVELEKELARIESCSKK
jgi:CII-binding regulator of phage lambda lysogenization HflD|tara:strand:- start:27 stop:251 length:225 start_codon:yes stop_codon:yes gene_type:complete